MIKSNFPLQILILTLSACAGLAGRSPASDHGTSKIETKVSSENKNKAITLQKPDSCSANSKACRDYFSTQYLPAFDGMYGEIKISKEIVFGGVKIPKGKFSMRALFDLMDPVFQIYEKQCAIKNFHSEYRSADTSSFSKLYHPCVSQAFYQDFMQAGEKVQHFGVEISGMQTNLAGLFQMVGAISYTYYSTVAPWISPSDSPLVTQQYFPSIETQTISYPQYNINSGFGFESYSTQQGMIQVAYNPYNWRSGGEYYSFFVPVLDKEANNKKSLTLEVKKPEIQKK